MAEQNWNQHGRFEDEGPITTEPTLPLIPMNPPGVAVHHPQGKLEKAVRVQQVYCIDCINTFRAADCDPRNSEVADCDGSDFSVTIMNRVTPGALIMVQSTLNMQAHRLSGLSAPNSNCPRGLEYLMHLDRLIVDQQVELLEAFTGFETENKYVVKDVQGRVVYYAAESSDCCARMCFGSGRPFEMRIVDAAMREVLQLSRPLNCSGCCFPCCLQVMDVFSNGERLGSVIQNWSILQPSFSVLDASGNIIFRIRGPMCMCHCPCADVDFKVLSNDGEHHLGSISKKWSGLAREVFTDADVFGISFPGDLDVKMKAVLFGACFLIDFMYFENNHSH